MTVQPTVQERAYQLALTLPSIAAIRQQLVREGYDSVDAHLGSPSMRLALKRVRRQASKDAPAATEPS